MADIAKSDESVKKIVYWAATAGLGYCAQAFVANGNPRQDVLAAVWLITLGIAIAVYFIWRSEAAQREEERNQHQDIMDRLDAIDKQQGRLLDAQQKVMRSDIIHRIERAVDGQCITPEEHQAIMEEYNSYDSLGLNGYMKVYLEMLDKVKICER